MLVDEFRGAVFLFVFFCFTQILLACLIAKQTSKTSGIFCRALEERFRLKSKLITDLVLSSILFLFFLFLLSRPERASPENLHLEGAGLQTQVRHLRESQLEQDQPSGPHQGQTRGQSTVEVPVPLVRQIIQTEARLRGAHQQAPRAQAEHVRSVRQAFQLQAEPHSPRGPVSEKSRGDGGRYRRR